MIADVRARTTTGARNGLRYLLYGFGLLLALLTASCGNNIISVGTPCITLTAKPGRFTSYIVTLDEITLTRQDNTVIELPTINQRIDLANLTAYANLLEAPAVEIGTYVKATFILDFSSQVPYVSVESNGQSVAPSLIDPATSAAPTTMAITVRFDPTHPLVINDQQSTVVNLDIDLEASNIIGTASDGTPQVTIKPFWNVNAQPTYDKPVYARGLYVLTDTKNSQIIFNVRPLHDVLDNPFGALKVNVGANTYFNVNGTAYVGAAGLNAVASLTNVYANLQIAAYGPPSGNPYADLSTITPVFNATQIYVGSSLESTLEDQITGVVASISGDNITVQRAAYVDRLGNYGFREALPVTVSSNTIVSVDGTNTPASLSSISVGQVVTALGLGTVTDTTDFNPVSFDASGSQLSGAQIRIQNTPLLATFNSASSPSSAFVSMVAVNHTDLLILDFAGTGNAGAGQADATASNYAITTPTDLSATAPGTFLDFNGTMTAFGQGPPFYTATSVDTNVEQQLVIEWSGTGSLSPFTSYSTNGYVVNLADLNLTGGTNSSGSAVAAGTVQVRTGPAIDADLLQNKPASTTLTVLFNTQDPQHPPLYGIGSVAVGGYLSTVPQGFANDTVNLTTASSSEAFQKLVAYGHYDPTTATFSATRMTINMK